MFSSIKKKAKGLFDHKESHDEHEEDERKKSEEVIANKSDDNASDVNDPEEDEKASERAQKNRKANCNIFEPQTSFDF